MIKTSLKGVLTERYAQGEQNYLWATNNKTV